VPELDRRYAQYRERLDTAGQGHLLAYWAELSEPERAQLLSDLDQIDLELCVRLAKTHVLSRPVLQGFERLEPVEVWPAEPDVSRQAFYRQALEAGQEAIASGRVAAFTVAGGQGTRLGFDGPKGAFPLSPVRNASLFQLFAEALHGCGRRYRFRPPWYIMTSPNNHDQTRAFFETNRYFGLSPADVVFFMQGQIPAFFPDGRIALAERYRVALSPDGHGGSFHALKRSGALEDMRDRGVEHISYFQVDNPLAKVLDPLFIGLHILTGSEMSSKAVTKADDFERVGNFCLADGKLVVIEYSDFPQELACARNSDGSRRFNAGNVAIHVVSRQFVERLVAGGAAASLPWHRAEKVIRAVDPAAGSSEPVPTSVVKLERFVFDALPLARNPIVLYTAREEEFSPVKNAVGVDSVETARRDMIRRAARWLESCGVCVPRDVGGEPALALEISPAFALDVEDLRARLTFPLDLVAGRPFVLV
jgi:UDP-N-acetylglucosamine/UDP-N-acetylgalactosamine diphosphorylase